MYLHRKGRDFESRHRPLRGGRRRTGYLRLPFTNWVGWPAVSAEPRRGCRDLRGVLRIPGTADIRNARRME